MGWVCLFHLTWNLLIFILLLLSGTSISSSPTPCLITSPQRSSLKFQVGLFKILHLSDRLIFSHERLGLLAHYFIHGVWPICKIMLKHYFRFASLAANVSLLWTGWGHVIGKRQSTCKHGSLKSVTNDFWNFIQNLDAISLSPGCTNILLSIKFYGKIILFSLHFDMYLFVSTQTNISLFEEKMFPYGK